jgi:hypothetical protein
MFLPRHGYGHTIPPHVVNYRANLWALHHHKAAGIISVASVGGIRSDLQPGDIVIPDQIIDYTWGRKSTFFDGNGTPVTHIDFTEPYDAGSLRGRIREAGQALGIAIKVGGVYAATQGPRLETRGRNQPPGARWCRSGRHDRHAGGRAGPRTGRALCGDQRRRQPRGRAGQQRQWHPFREPGIRPAGGHGRVKAIIEKLVGQDVASRSMSVWPQIPISGQFFAADRSHLRSKPRRSDFQALHQLGFEPDAAAASREVAAADQEDVLRPLAQRGDLGGVQVGPCSASVLATV